MNQAEILAERRRRLSDISWWMRCTTEHIARRANREDRCTGHFWEGRYKCQLLLDEASLLACAAYVDLNPVRAAMAETPEASSFTGAKDRIDDLNGRKTTTRKSGRGMERDRPGPKSGWLSPIETGKSPDGVGPDACHRGRRASHKGFLPFSLCEYLELLDWTGRQLRGDKRGSIPDHVSPILQRIGLDAPEWCDVVRKFGRTFKRAAGTAEHLAAEAERRGLHTMRCRLAMNVPVDIYACPFLAFLQSTPRTRPFFRIERFNGNFAGTACRRVGVRVPSSGLSTSTKVGPPSHLGDIYFAASSESGYDASGDGTPQGYDQGHLTPNGTGRGARWARQYYTLVGWICCIPTRDSRHLV